MYERRQKDRENNRTDGGCHSDLNDLYIWDCESQTENEDKTTFGTDSIFRKLLEINLKRNGYEFMIYTWCGSEYCWMKLFVHFIENHCIYLK